MQNEGGRGKRMVNVKKDWLGKNAPGAGGAKKWTSKLAPEVINS